MAEIEKQRWCIYIDILGFSTLWKHDQMKALRSLCELMRTIYRVGTHGYPCASERLFVHQMGDGFAIVSDFGEPTLARPIAIATALMRCVASTDTFAAAAIAEGAFQDITGCYPKEVTDHIQDGVVALGEGLMTLSSVMGTAFIRAYGLNNNAPSGPFLVLPECSLNRLPDGLPVRVTEGKKDAKLLSIDWVHANMPLLTELQDRACLSAPTPGEIEEAIRTYCAEYRHTCEKWKVNLCRLLDIEIPSDT